MSDLSVDIKDLKSISTSHDLGEKFVFKNSEQLNNSLTQVAFGVFLPKVSCETHVHLTMFKYFYFLSGNGTYLIGGESFKVYKGVLIEIPAGIWHSLECQGSEDLEFLYWGVAV